MKLQEQWEALKLMLAEAEKDVIKNSEGNKSAGVRTRKHLKQISDKIKELKAISLETGKSTDE